MMSFKMSVMPDPDPASPYYIQTI